MTRKIILGRQNDESLTEVSPEAAADDGATELARTSRCLAPVLATAARATPGVRFEA